MLSALGASSVRQHLRRRFFRNHLARYSKSRRKAPIYWPLAVPSRNWGIWVYAPRALTRDAVCSRRRGARVAKRSPPRPSGGSRRSGTRAEPDGALERYRTALGSEEALAEELATFRSEAERIAGLGWEPDLDDGIILCAAPLAPSFLARRGQKAAKMMDPAKTSIPWATVSRWKGAALSDHTPSGASRRRTLRSEGCERHGLVVSQDSPRAYADECAGGGRVPPMLCLRPSDQNWSELRPHVKEHPRRRAGPPRLVVFTPSVPPPGD